MPKLTALVLTTLLFVTAVTVSADGKAKPKLSDIAPVENFTSAADEKIVALQKYVATPETFDKSARKLKRDAGMVAIFAQVIAEHDQDSPAKQSAVPLRNAALKLAVATTLEDATQSLKELKQAQAGKGTSGDVSMDWAQLINFDSLMNEVAVRNRAVGRAVRKMRRGLDQNARDEVAHDADILAVLAMVAAADTHPVKDKATIDGWKNFANEQRTAAIATAAAFRKNDAQGAKTAYTRLAKSCSGCHKAYRK
ncbi:hypothetical protein [Symmachiella dynata]|uniref:hypothetical protein n=1 Tax=Symmachiella dynata TaxID=2527995 RepID=UPI0030EE1A89